MSHQTDIQQLTLSDIAHHCTQETNRFFQGQSYDPQYCFELFRRAIMDRDQRAWELVYAQYRPLVAGWVERHPAFPASGEEVQYFVNRTFEKMWGALTPDKFNHFSDLKSLLRYLQMCIHSVLLDCVRTAEQSAVKVQVEDALSQMPSGVRGAEASAVENQAKGPSAEDEALAWLHRQELWWEINARLRNEKERRVAYGSFVLALKPRELYAQYRETFRDVNEVYRLKENMLGRLRRDTELKKFLGDAWRA